MRYLLYQSPYTRTWKPCIGAPLRSEESDQKFGRCVRTGLYLIRLISPLGDLGPVVKTMRWRVRPMAKDHPARSFELGLDDGLNDDPHLRAWRKL